jgi:multidrug resistance efflux pump
MELEIYNAFVKAGVSEENAKSVVDSLNREIDRRYALHASQLATRGDIADIQKNLAEMETRLQRTMAEMQRWTLTAIFAGMGAVAVITKLWH